MLQNLSRLENFAHLPNSRLIGLMGSEILSSTDPTFFSCACACSFSAHQVSLSPTFEYLRPFARPKYDDTQVHASKLGGKTSLDETLASSNTSESHFQLTLFRFRFVLSSHTTVPAYLIHSKEVTCISSLTSQETSSYSRLF